MCRLRLLRACVFQHDVPTAGDRVGAPLNQSHLCTRPACTQFRNYLRLLTFPLIPMNSPDLNFDVSDMSATGCGRPQLM